MPFIRLCVGRKLKQASASCMEVYPIVILDEPFAEWHFEPTNNSIERQRKTTIGVPL